MDTSMSNIGNPYKLGNVPGFCPTCMEPIRHHAKDCPERHAEVRQPDVEDIVVKPSHYARWAIEPITFIMRNGFEFWRGNATKYIARAGYKAYAGKSQVESEVTDLEKAIRCLQMRVNQLKGDTVL